jgi:PAS domain S-box-containing protein
MLWQRRVTTEHLTSLLGLCEGLAQATTLGGLVRVLGSSELAKELFDDVAIWQIRGAETNFVKSPGTDQAVSHIDIHGFFADSLPAPVKTTEDGFGLAGSGLLCPLLRDQQLVGAVGFFRASGPPFDPQETALAAMAAAQLVSCVESINLRSELVEQTEELRSQRDSAEEILNRIKSAIVVVDSNWIVLRANPYAAETLGAVAAELTGRSIEEVLPSLRECASQGLREATLELSNGTSLQLGFSVSPLNPSDPREGAIILFRDLSEIVELRQQLRRKEYFAVVGETASWIAHEAKTPLFAISSIAKLLIESIDENELRKLVVSILTESERLTKLVDDMLQYGKPLELRTERACLEEILAHARQQLAASMAQSECSMEIDMNGESASEVDQAKIEQVVYNIVSNAMEADSRRIIVGARNRGGWLDVTFRDDGKGIREGNLGKIFRPFFSTKKAGTGLGLPICKKIVEEHGGTMSIRSEPGKGTEVTIALRAAS